MSKISLSGEQGFVHCQIVSLVGVNVESYVQL